MKYIDIKLHDHDDTHFTSISYSTYLKHKQDKSANWTRLRLSPLHIVGEMISCNVSNHKIVRWALIEGKSNGNASLKFFSTSEQNAVHTRFYDLQIILDLCKFGLLYTLC